MRSLLIILIFLSHAGLAQVDSIRHSAGSIKASVEYRLDSVEASFSVQVDSLTQSYGILKNKIESLKANYESKIDSLNNFKLSTEKYSSKVDSLNNQLINAQLKVTSKLDSLKANAASKIKSLNLPPEASGKINSLTSAIDKVDFASIDKDVIHKLELGNLNKSLDLSASGIDAALPAANLPSANIPGVNLSNVITPDLGVQEQLESVNDITGKAGNIQAQLKEIGTVEGAGKAIENKVGELEQVKAIQGQTGLSFQAPATGEEAKEQVKELAKKEAVNHFAGKEATVQQAMDKMSKYKQKYNSVSSLTDLPKKASNPIKEKQFIERLLPGVALQMSMKESFMMDVAPYVGYRFTSRLTAGFGWNQRASFNAEKSRTQTNVYGPRIYGEYKLVKGFSGRLEVETMSTYVTQGINADFGHREWVPAILAGMKQQYSIYKGLRGTAFVLYNFYNPDYKSPYGDRISARIGFEYVFKKKKKK